MYKPIHCSGPVLAAVAFAVLMGSRVGLAQATSQGGIAGAPDSAAASEMAKIRQIARDLANPAAHDAALAKAKALPASAIIPLWTVDDDPSLSVDEQQGIADALQAIYKRAREERAAANSKLTAEWTRAAGIEAFKRISGDPKWNDLVEKGLQALSGDPGAAMDDFKKAMDTGCNDPLVRYFYFTRAMDAGRVSWVDGVHAMDKVALDMENSDYPASRKLVANAVFARISTDTRSPHDVTDERASHALRYAINLFPRMLAENPGPAVIRDLTKQLMTASTAMHRGDPQNGAAEVMPVIKTALPDSALYFETESEAYIGEAEKASIERKPDETEEHRFQLVMDLYKKAQASAEQGWQIDPVDSNCATDMVFITTHQREDRDTMETWFARATCADPDRPDAYRYKAQFLLNFGTAAEELEFSKYCIKYGSVKGRVPMLAIDIIVSLRARADDPTQFMSQDDVWSIVSSAYGKMLGDGTRLQADRTRCLQDRAFFVEYACDCGKWAEALKLINEFGTDVDVNAIGGQDLYDFFRTRARERAGK